MPYTFDTFCADCRAILLVDDPSTGLEALQGSLEKLLADPSFIKERLGRDVSPGKHVLHHDLETDMYVLAHIYESAGKSPPHDHGDHWVIYGNATKYTDMTEWSRVDDGSREDFAKLEIEREYRINAGSAVLFRAGQIHSISYPAETRFIRLTGGDVEGGKNLRFDVENDRIEVQDRSEENRRLAQPKI